MLFTFMATALLSFQGNAPSGPPVPAASGSQPQEQPKPPSPDERSKALEELLRRLSDTTEHPSLVPPNPAEPPVAPGERPIDPARLKALLTRASDSVEIALANHQRRELEYWDNRLEIGVGDEVRQGPKSCTTLDWGDGAHFRFDGLAVWHMASDGLADPRRFAIDQLARKAELQLGAGERDVVIDLPGGNQIAGRRSRLTLHGLDIDDRSAIELRNGGPEPVVVRSPYLGGRTITIGAGQRVFLPVLPEPAAFVAHLTHDATLHDELHGRLHVQAPEQIRLAIADETIDAENAGRIPGIARACGARVVLRPGESIRLARVPLGTPRQREQDE